MNSDRIALLISMNFVDLFIELDYYEYGNTMGIWIVLIFCGIAMADQANLERTETIQRLNVTIDDVGGEAFNGMTVFRLRTGFERFQQMFANLEQQNRLAASYAADVAARTALSTEFYDLEERYLDACATFQQRIAEMEQAAAAAAAAVANQPAGVGAANGLNPNARVFQLNMPFQPQSVQPTWGEFIGDPLEWYDFKQRFKLGCHDVDEIPKANKVQYLRKALVGKAVDDIKGFPIQADSYDALWNELVTKNEKRFPLACAYLSRFFGLPKLRQATAEALQRMSSAAKGMRRQLMAMEYPVENWDLIIVHALQERLDKIYAAKWSLEIKNNDNPTADQIIKFLDDEAILIANHGLTYAPLTVHVQNERAKPSTAPAAYQPPPPSQQLQRSVYFPCGACGNPDHLIFKCPEFLPQTLSQRTDTVNANRLCYNCLRKHHFIHQCEDTARCSIPQCVKKNDTMHNSLLCPYKVPATNHAAFVQQAPQSSQSGGPSHGRSSSKAKRGRGRDRRNKRRGDTNSS